jgi:hypothetical protein
VDDRHRRLVDWIPRGVAVLVDEPVPEVVHALTKEKACGVFVAGTEEASRRSFDAALMTRILNGDGPAVLSELRGRLRDNGVLALTVGSLESIVPLERSWALIEWTAGQDGVRFKTDPLFDRWPDVVRELCVDWEGYESAAMRYFGYYGLKFVDGVRRTRNRLAVRTSRRDPARVVEPIRVLLEARAP